MGAYLSARTRRRAQWLRLLSRPFRREICRGVPREADDPILRVRVLQRESGLTSVSHAGNASSNLAGVTKKSRDSDFGRSPLVRCGKYVSAACTPDLAPVQVRDSSGVILNRDCWRSTSASIRGARHASFEPINALRGGPGCAPEEPVAR